MKSIRDTFIFKMQNKDSGLKKKMMQYDTNLDDLDLKLIEDQLSTIKKRFNGYPVRNIILDNVANGIIVPIYNKDHIKIVNCVPSYLYVKNDINNNKKVVALVNLTNYATLDKDSNYLKIEPRTLFGLLQSGQILITCRDKWNSISINQNICKLGSAIYSRMVLKVLDKMFAVNYDPIKADKIKFLASKFFLINMMEKKDGKIVNDLSFGNITNNTTRNTIDIYSEEVNPKAFEDLQYFIMELSKLDGLGNLKIRTFLDVALQLYGVPILFAFEYLPLFFHNVFSVVIGCKFNKEFVLENVFGKDAEVLYNTFTDIIR